MKSVLLLVAAALVSGCAAGRLYPVQGPLSAQRPPPIYKLRMGNYDAISTRLANGKLCSGNWLDVVQGDPTARDMSAEWDLVYGNGFFAANVLGKNGIARAILNCPDEMKVTVEFNSTNGVAKDSNGNVFKLMF
ncbi:MAG TPA: hypothetical protein VIY90_05235 [Steroidobacteraceae bacterium]